MDQITFVEAGGFYGMTTDFVLEDQPEWNVVILEPTPRLFEGLVKKYENEPRVKVWHRALWNKNEVKTFHASGHSGASSLCGEKSNLGECEKVDVECVRASTFLALGQGTVVLNLNCEGAEIEIMEDLMESGAYKSMMIFVQNHKDVMPEPELYDAMFNKMDEVGVDYMRGTYGKVHKGAIKLKMTIKEFLVRYNKPEWAEVF